MNANEKQGKMSGNRVPHRSRNIGIAAASAVLAITGLGACTASRTVSPAAQTSTPAPATHGHLRTQSPRHRHLRLP